MDDNYRNIRPKAGQIVRDPSSKAILPETISTVSWIGSDGKYWKRRLRDGSIEIVEETITETKPKKFYKEDK